MKYPTKDEILANLYIPTDEELRLIADWKREYYIGWGKKPKTNKIFALWELAFELSYPKPPLDIQFTKAPWSYNLATQSINGSQNNLSIISLLHELGHHINIKGGELWACQYSIGIFKKCFPLSYKKLIWHGHTLKSKEDNTANKKD